ncbi:MAG: helix-hairpin-helix domain-containing protein [Candidatus Atribacteria bacterium]
MSTASLEKFINILKVNEYIIQKIIELRDELGEFKEAKDLLQLSELTNL